MKNLFILFSLLLLNIININAQTATLYGKVLDEKGEALISVNIYVENNEIYGTQTDIDGRYELSIPADETVYVIYSYTGYTTQTVRIGKTKEGKRVKQDINLKEEAQIIEGATITADGTLETGGMIKEGTETLRVIPNSTGSVESMLHAIGIGVTTGQGGGALSSQYSVRGGNYDENLVYVNDFEVYRPQLIRAGQQEGLTFPNMDLIRDLSFSSGGFDPRFGDKMSSVLDIHYKRPTDFGASVEGSLLGGSFHIEGSKKFKKDSLGYRRFRYMVGTRYKTTRYVLGSLDTKGEYVPNFSDIQGYFTFDLTNEWNLGILTNFNRSRYNFVPESRTTAFGLIDFSLALTTVFEGQEVDDFTTYMGGVSLSYVPENNKNPLYMKVLLSSYQSDENERIDIIGDYLIGQIDSDLGSDDFGEIVSVLGTGTQHLFVRNYLTSRVTNASYTGGVEFKKDSINFSNDNDYSAHFFQWGLTYQNEYIDDKLNEWERLDSAGYSLPYSDENVLLFSTLKTANQIQSNRFRAFIQDTWTTKRDSMSLKIIYGVRAAYWDLNNEFFVSPRAQIIFEPRTKKDMTLRWAGGLYYQPPFYREMRNLQGVVNTNLLSQKSAHALFGYTLDFKIGNTPFKFITEAYYKHLWDLVSYDLDNVRIRYSGENDARGYVAGIDFRLNGEFVKGEESWINLSFLRARERLVEVQHLQYQNGELVEVKDVARPTDQLMSLSMFFQDHLPKNENFKMHLNLTVGTGWPFGFPANNTEFRNSFRFASYHRVDIGFSFKLWNRDWEENRPKHPLRFTKNTWLSLEVFNLLEVSNQASNTWIKTLYGSYFAVPNYLTSRRINLRLRMEF